MTFKASRVCLLQIEKLEVSSIERFTLIAYPLYWRKLKSHGWLKIDTYNSMDIALNFATHHAQTGMFNIPYN